MSFSGLRAAALVFGGLALLGTPLLADSIFGYSASGLQTFTATTSGVYQITVDGASGGNNGPGIGGHGASLVEDVTLSSGEVLDLYVGQAGTYGGGGGGTFVFVNGVPIIVAGGGGGAAYDGNDPSMSVGGNALLTNMGGTPGAGGNGGAANSGGAGVPGTVRRRYRRRRRRRRFE